MRVTDRELNNYYRQIKKMLVCKRSEQKRFICSFADNVEEYLKDHPDADLTELQEIMGTPQEIADEFLANESADKIKKRISVFKLVLICCVIALVMFGVALLYAVIESHYVNFGHADIYIVD